MRLHIQLPGLLPPRRAKTSSLSQVKCPSLWAPKPIQLMWYGIQRCFSPVPFHSPRTLFRYRKTKFKRINNLQDSSMKRNLRKPAGPEPRTPSLTRPKLFLFTGLPPVPKLAFQTGLRWKVIITIKGSSTTFIQNKFHFPLLSSPSADERAIGSLRPPPPKKGVNCYSITKYVSGEVIAVLSLVPP